MTFNFIEHTPEEDFMEMIRKSSLEAIRKLCEKQQVAERMREEFKLKRMGLGEDDYQYVTAMFELNCRQERELNSISRSPSTADLRQLAEPYLPKDNEDKENE